MNKFFAYTSSGPDTPWREDTYYNIPFEHEGNWIISGYHSGNDVYPEPVVTEELVNMKTRAPQIIEDKKAEIKELQCSLIKQIEGEGKWRVSRAVDMAEMDSDFSGVDEIMKQRTYVRKRGDELEESLQNMTFAELGSFVPVINVEDAPDIGTRRITVGGFLARLSRDEYAALDALRASSEDVQRAYNELRGRTHVLLDDPKIVAFIIMMETNNLLSEASVGYDSRKEELLRDATVLERYRQYSIV